jgi:MipA family protein
VTNAIESWARNTSRVRAGALLLAALLCDRALAQSEEPTYEDITVSTERKTALQAETLSISATPEAAPHLGHPSYIVGFGALVGPAYDGSNKTKVSPYPYVDIRGLWDDRLFVSSLRGIGLNLLDSGPFRGGLTLNYAAGRTSSDDPRLRGLPDIKSGAEAGAFLTWSYKALSVEAVLQNTFGSDGRAQAAVGANYAFAPVPRMHLSIGAHANWGDSRFERVNFGVTPAEAAQANALGNSLTAYDARAGVTTIGLTGAGLYQIGRHWGLVGRVGLQELVGAGAKNSPLTQKAFFSTVALGAMYQF